MNKQAIQDYWNRKPCNSWWPEVGWDITEHKKFVEPHIWEWSEFPRWTGKRVLDLGCGIGTMSLEFARAGAYVDAVDISGESLSIARKRAEETSLDRRIVFWEKDLETMDFPFDQKKSYDLAYSFGVLHHTPNPLVVLQRAWYMLEGNGELWIMVYNRLGWKRLIQGRPEAQAGCPLVTYWTRKSITNLLREAEFEPYDFQVQHIFPYKGEAYGQGRYELAFPWNVPGIGKWLHKRLEPIFGQHLLVKARKV